MTLATDPAVSESQRRAMWAAREGRSTLGIPKKVGEEFTKGEKPVGEDDEESATFLQQWANLARGLLHWIREEQKEPEHPGAEAPATDQDPPASSGGVLASKDGFMPVRGDPDRSSLIAPTATQAPEVPPNSYGQVASGAETPDDPFAAGGFQPEPSEDCGDEDAEDCDEEAEDEGSAGGYQEYPRGVQSAQTAGDEPAYHGTRAVAVQSILDNGLLAHPNAHQHPSRFYEGERGGSVYLAADPQTAATWALSEVQNPADATVLEVDVPAQQLVPDEYATEAERFVGNIPPQWIVAAYPVMDARGTVGQPMPLNGGGGHGQSRFVALTHAMGATEAPLENPQQSVPDALPDDFPGTLPQNPPQPPPQTPITAPAGQPPFVDVGNGEAIQDTRNGQIYGVEALIQHMAAQDDTPTFANFRDTEGRRCGDPQSLGVYVRAKLDPDWNPEKPGGIDSGSWRRIRAAIADEIDPGMFSGWAKGKLGPPAHDAAPPATMAMDWAGVAGLRDHVGPGRSDIVEMAFDKASVRAYDHVGRLHIDSANISKAQVSPYLGSEIPGAEEMGLDPKKKYHLLRHPDELAAAAETFDRLPVLSEHVPLSAAAHRKDLTIGSTGERARFEPPYLKNSLVFWEQPAIDGIEQNIQKELSCAYHYDVEMVPGVYQGQKYDGIMRNLKGNHLALVKEGRAGADVVVGDSALVEYDLRWTVLANALKWS